MIIALSAGHNVINNGYFDHGSISPCGKFKEADITRRTVALLKPTLEAMGHTVHDVTPYDQKFYSGGGKSASRKAHEERSRRIKVINPDIYIDIHVNAGGGTGPECLVYSTKSKAYPYARKITNSIAKNTGLTNRRGVKVKPGYWSVTLHPQPSIIVEGAFIDSPGGKDMRVLTPEVYAYSIASCFGEVNDLLTEKRVREICKEEIAKAFRKPDKDKHWADKHLANLIAKGLVIHERRLDDPITRGETLNLLDQITE